MKGGAYAFDGRPATRCDGGSNTINRAITPEQVFHLTPCCLPPNAGSSSAGTRLRLFLPSEQLTL